MQYALVDDDDYPIVAPYDWRYSPNGWTGYAIVRPPNHITMHRLITDAPPEKVVHHWNQDGLDNRRTNLYPCSLSEHRTLPHRRPPATIMDRGHPYVISPERQKALADLMEPLDGDGDGN